MVILLILLFLQIGRGNLSHEAAKNLIEKRVDNKNDKLFKFLTESCTGCLTYVNFQMSL
jgi:hypothetical protein